MDIHTFMKWKQSDLYNHPLGRRPSSLSHSHLYALMNYAESKVKCAQFAFACCHALLTHTDAARSRILPLTLSLSLPLGSACNVMFWLFVACVCLLPQRWWHKNNFHAARWISLFLFCWVAGTCSFSTFRLILFPYYYCYYYYCSNYYYYYC